MKKTAHGFQDLIGKCLERSLAFSVVTADSIRALSTKASLSVTLALELETENYLAALQSVADYK